MTAAGRQQTLESQRERQVSPSILKRLLGRSGDNAPKSGPVDDVIRKGAAILDRDGEKFMKDFRDISHRPKARLREIFDIFIRLPHTAAESVEPSTRSGSITSARQ